MKLWIDKRPFSWNMSYTIYEEDNTPSYKVMCEGSEKVSTITLMNANDMELGKVVQTRKFFSPRYEIFLGDELMANIVKSYEHKITRYVLKYRQWRVFGNILGWEYDIFDEQFLALHVGCEDPDFPDKYVIDGSYSNNDVPAILVVLGMEAANYYFTTKDFGGRNLSGK